MNPRLAAIAGKLQGTVFPMGASPMVIGRETAATVCLADASVSRRHSQIEHDKSQFFIADLDSLNGTFVNDVPIRRRALEHGDRVRIGDSQFLFLLHDGDVVAKSNEVALDDRQLLSGSTVQFRFNDAAYLMARDLTALMKVSTTINSIRGLPELEKRLLELLFEVVPAQRGAILISDTRERTGENEFSSMFGWDRVNGPDRTTRVSRSVAQRVLHEGTALLISSPAETAQLDAQSLADNQTTCVLCVPLIMAGNTLGVIYLDTNESNVCFDKDHLQLVSAIASIAAVAIENSKRFDWLESENQRLIADAEIEHNMVGESQPMRNVYQFVAKVAPTDSTVLIYGESGTGKELMARAIHQNSKRADKPFIGLNCAALSETLLESELFGHEKGSFTGAYNQRKGRLEIVDGGTLFLDEIAELSLALQVKLLRVLQEREFERVGGTRTIKIDIRLLTATNRNLEELIAQGTFREDLFYRLNVLQVEMPPLRKRPEDVSLLANYFAVKYGEKCNRRITGISAEAQTCLMNYDWPGNVRELENTIERALVLGTTDVILLDDLPESLLETAPLATVSGTRYHDAVVEAKKKIIVQAMAESTGNYTEAAKVLGVHVNYLHRLIKNLDLKERLNRQDL